MARVVVPGCPHHVTHRGNLRADSFFDDSDRQIYKALLAQCARQFGLEIWAFCLMTNHVHLIVVPHEVNSIALAIGRTHQRYAAAVNARNGWTGHLWANRYFSTPLDHDHLWTAVKYVELNPVRARLVERAEAYPYSSAACHARLCDEPLLSTGRPFPGPVSDWSEFLRGGLSEQQETAIRMATYTGRPFGGAEFIARLEAQTGRLLAPQKRGRKPQQQTAESLVSDLFEEVY